MVALFKGKAAPAPRPAPAPPPPVSDGGNRYTRPIPRPNLIPQQQGWLSYNWIDKDPELDFVVACIAESGRSPEWIEERTADFGHKVSKYTIYNWSYGNVRRPQNASISSVMAAIGYNKKWEYTG